MLIADKNTRRESMASRGEQKMSPIPVLFSLISNSGVQETMWEDQPNVKNTVMMLLNNFLEYGIS